jgi:uncharacterized protein (DUF2132 family)
VAQTLCLYLIFLVLLPACVPEKAKRKTRVVKAKRVRKSELIIPSTELSAFSKEEECAFLLDIQKNKSKTSVSELARQYEARLVDIPIPVSVKAEKVSVDTSGKKMLIYKTEVPMKHVQKFYLQEMERLGWNKEYSFEGPQVLLNFKKPNRFCSVMLRPLQSSLFSKQQFELVLFITA